MTPQDKKARLAAALAKIEKSYGEGAVMRMGDRPAKPISAISTGSLGLDIALGIGGLPRGRIIEIYGPESSGKTTIALQVAAQAQKAGGIAAFIDAEHALDPTYAGKLGVDIDELILSQPDHGEQALEIAETLVRSESIDVVVIDSVAALTPRAEIEGEMTDMQPGMQARLMSKAMRKLNAAISQSGAMVIFINQLRQKIGVMFGSPETTTGGNALKFYASIRLDIRRIAQIKKGDEIVGKRNARESRQKTNSRRLSGKRCSRFITAKASRARANCSIWARREASCKNRARGIRCRATPASASAKAKTARACGSKSIPPKPKNCAPKCSPNRRRAKRRKKPPPRKKRPPEKPAAATGAKQNGRGSEIRTHGLLLPKQARYQTAPYPDERRARFYQNPRQAFFAPRPPPRGAGFSLLFGIKKMTSFLFFPIKIGKIVALMRHEARHKAIRAGVPR